MRGFFSKLIAAGILGAQLLGTASTLAEARSIDHYLCLEHQEWTHEEKHAVSTSHGAKEDSGSPASNDLLKAASRSYESHEHCEVLARPSGPSLELKPASADLAAPPASEPSTLEPSSTRVAGTGIPLYRLAPKNSPPSHS